MQTSTGEILVEPAPTPAHDLNEADRSTYLDEIVTFSKRLGRTEAQQKVAWARAIGPNVKEENAPIDLLMKLRDDLATQIKGLPG